LPIAQQFDNELLLNELSNLGQPQFAPSVANDTPAQCLVLRRQESISSYEHEGNNRRYMLHDVVKNDPFILELAIEPIVSGDGRTSKMTFNDALQISLIYNDFDVNGSRTAAVTEGQSLRLVKPATDANALNWTVLKKTDTTATVSVRVVNALSSHHKDKKHPRQQEGHFFLLVQLRHGIHELCLFSHSIRVVSRRNVVQYAHASLDSKKSNRKHVTKHCDQENDDDDNDDDDDAEDADERRVKRARKMPKTAGAAVVPAAIRSALAQVSSNQQLMLSNQARLLALFEALLGLTTDKATRAHLLSLAPSVRDESAP